MDILLSILVVLLALCVFGAFVLIVIVTWDIGKEIWRESTKREASEKVDTCKWSKLSPMDDYTTECKHNFYDASESGNPITDTMNFCPYCGKPIKE